MTANLTGVEEVLFLSEAYDSREALEAEVEAWDATTSGWYSWCPRVAQYSHRMGLTQIEEALPLLAGSAIHAGMDVLYTADDEDLAIQAVLETFGDRDPPAPSHKYSHIHGGFLEAIFKNYLVWRRTHDTFIPLVVRLDELDMTNVVGAVLRVLPDERVILGESKLIMRFLVDGRELIYAGKPDLPILYGDRAYLFDHKVSCGSYLSDWYFEKHVLSNQFRGYAAMLQSLLGRTVEGAYINGIYAGDKALETHTRSGAKSSITRFTRYGPLLYTEDHLEEALWNQYAWRQVAFIWQEMAEQHPAMYQRFGYAQNTGKSCQGCHYLEICKAQPRARGSIILKKYTQRRRSFLDL